NCSECRSCRDITIDDLANCLEGGTCDEKEPLRAEVLTASDPCTCQSLRCANRGWRLAVNGTIVDKVFCKEGHWFTTRGLIASSFVCAKPTSPGIPATPKSLICPVLMPADLDKCEMSVSLSRLPCSAAPSIAEPEVSCPTTQMYLDMGTYRGASGIQLLCDPVQKDWVLKFSPEKTVAMYTAQPPGTPIFVACT
ncbi:hypothetical protein PENTCL1PPCAC_9726, partial [Pristionchus entomophagus]